MRYPVENFKTEWNGTAGYGYGAATSYGFHDGLDINDNGAGNSDLGKPLYAIAKGKIIGLHQHTGTGNFGKHFFLQVDGEWGTRYVHYAHCNELFIKLDDEVQEGQKIATVGNSGTVYAHCHFAIKHKANGMDTIANTKAQLVDAWEDPIKFIEFYEGGVIVAEPNFKEFVVRTSKSIYGDDYNENWNDAEKKAFLDKREQKEIDYKKRAEQPAAGANPKAEALLKAVKDAVS